MDTGGNRGKWLHHARFIIHGHDADQRRRGLQGGIEGVHIQQAVALHRQHRYLRHFRQRCRRIQHRLVLRLHREQMRLLDAVVPQRAFQGEVICLRCTAGEDHLARVGMDDRRKLRPRRFQRLPGGKTGGIGRAGVGGEAG